MGILALAVLTPTLLSPKSAKTHPVKRGNNPLAGFSVRH